MTHRSKIPSEFDSTEANQREARLHLLREMAADCFDAEDVAVWMRMPHLLLGGASPEHLGGSIDGFQQVKNLLINLKYGIPP